MTVPGGVEHVVARPSLVGLAIGGVAVLALCLPLFPSLVQEWIAFPNLSHGFAIPLIAGYLVWIRRARIVRLPVTPSWWGVPAVGGAFALYAAGQAGGEPFLARLAFPIALLGTTLLLVGASIMREAWPGIAYLFFMIPPPYLVLKGLTDRARLLDATVTASVLPWLGIPVLQEGFLLHLSNMTLEVADVCSSIPAIASLLALGAAYGLVRGRSLLGCLVVLLAAPPLGILSNIVRILLTAAGAHYLGPIALHNVIHMWNGATVFLMTFAALILVDRVTTRLLGGQG